MEVVYSETGLQEPFSKACKNPSQRPAEHRAQPRGLFCLMESIAMKSGQSRGLGYGAHSCEASEDAAVGLESPSPPDCLCIS